MKRLIKNLTINANEAEIVDAVDRHSGYEKDASGKQYYLEAEGEKLRQVYDDEVIEWRPVSSQLNGVANCLEVEFTC